MIEFHFEKAPALRWEQLIESRIERSSVVACVKRGAVTATLFYDRQDHKFSLQADVPACDHGGLHDCELRRQHGGMALVFMQMNLGGLPMATGHAYLRGKLLVARLKAGYEFSFPVDPGAPHFERLLGQRARASGARNWQPALEVAAQRAKRPEEADDFSEMDLKRLRGEIAIHESQSMRDARSSDRRWRT